MNAPPKSISQERLASLEIGRGVAALLVVLFHYEFYTLEYLGSRASLARWFEGGHAGVEYFFALSGFIIYYVHVRDIGKTDKLSNFLAKRTVRIAPIYWVVITSSLLALAGNPIWWAKRGLSFYSIIADYLLLPRSGQLILEPAWTLKREALFYAVFSLIIVAPSLGFPAFALWQAAIVVANLFFFSLNDRPNGLLVYFFDVHNLGFGLGLGCAWFVVSVSRATIRSGVVALLIGLLGVLGAMAFEWFADDNFAGLQSAAEEIGLSGAYTASFTLVILGFVLLELSSGFNIASKWKHAMVFGASSYAMYLIHDPIASVLFKIFASARFRSGLTPNKAYLLAVVMAVVASIAVHMKVEVPLTRLLRRKLVPRQEKSAAVGIGTKIDPGPAWRGE